MLNVGFINDARPASGNICLRAACLFAILTLLIFAESANAQTATQNRFEKNVQAYEAADKASAPPKGAILLVGDSQFYRWKTLHEDLPDFTIINRGIDSFQFSDILYFFDRVVLYPTSHV